MNKRMCVNPPGGRRKVPLNQDFFVSFGKTVLKPEEIVVSVFIPFSKKVKMVWSSATNNGDEILTPVEMTDIVVLCRCVTLELFSLRGSLFELSDTLRGRRALLLP